MIKSITHKQINKLLLIILQFIVIVPVMDFIYLN